MKSPSDSKLTLLDRFFHLIESAPSSDRLILRVSILTFLVSGIWLIFYFNQQHSEVTPTRGGSITEGIIGTPRSVNPALAVTRADQDVTALVYSGLMKIGQDGSLQNDLAENITISEDGLTYNVILRKDVTFHDGTPLTARDVAYTIQLIQNPDLRSPLRGHWVGVIVEEISEYELNIVIEKAYAPFIENLTLGIMPAHAWSSLPIEQLPFSQLNTEPIGSGPFAVTDATRDTSGLISYYKLSAYRNNGEDSKIDTIGLRFYSNEETLVDAIKKGEIDSSAYIPATRINELLDTGFKLIEEPLPRVFSIFFNQSRSASLRDASVREALSAALNKDVIIEKAFNGFSIPIDGPTLFSNSELESGNDINNASTSSEIDNAKKILSDGGWTENDLGLWEKEIEKETVTLSVILRTSNTELFASLSELIADQWKAIGVEVTIEQFEQAGLVQSVIRPRDFQALLFGHDISRSYDLYPVWHSSQQDDPGLNIAQYANVSVDSLLEEAHKQQSEDERFNLLLEASEIIKNESPAVFIAQPTMTYVVSEKMTLTDIKKIGRPADRFSNVIDWHTQNDSLWSIFRKKDEV